MLHKMGTFAGGGRKVSPPTPVYMNEDQKSAYLSGLRANRPSRPTGSRPPPFKTSNSSYTTAIGPEATLIRSDSAPVSAHAPQDPAEIAQHDADSQPSMPKSGSYSSSFVQKGRPIANAPFPSVRGRKISPTAVILHQENLEHDYRESTSRKLEKEEAHTLREALHIIDHQDEEQRVYHAAQDEAADLVWKHLNPKAAEEEKTAPYVNPDLQAKKSYGVELGNSSKENSRNASDGSTTSQKSNDSKHSRRSSNMKDRALSEALKELQIESEARANRIVESARANRRRSSGKRMNSNGSAKGYFPSSEHPIYEEPPTTAPTIPEEDARHLPLKIRNQNSLPRGSRPLPDKPAVVPTSNSIPWINRIEIQRNPPSQSRNAGYTANSSTPQPQITAPTVADRRDSADLEIRSDDIRAATSMKKKDRSPNLPTPVGVSDHFGRPIVSFDPNWRSKDSPRNSQDITRPVIKFTESPRASKDLQRPLPRPLASQKEALVSAPVVPTICLPAEDNDIPVVCVEDVSGPAISVSAPIPSIQIGPPAQKPSARPLPRHADTSPPKANASKRLPWLRSGLPGVPTVSCSSCALPISGRVVTASGSSSGALKARLHPDCFTCNHCSTALECVSFYPEPDNRREERLEAEGLAPDSAAADIRFYCHLDFHELFSPRCKSCKTPIEGEVIVAAGSEWHVGHFFCGECGDPFGSDTPFVEKEGYAYCVGCHTRRTSARCRGCKQQILDELTVEALGGKWHDSCFKCDECGDGFGDDGRFFIRDVVAEPTDKERRKGITSKVEEKAVCSACEERRLKA